MGFGILFLGFLIGMRHALEADHVAAVASLATGSRSLRQTVMQGALWGVGHTLTLFLFGSVALMVDGVIPEQLAAMLEFAVGIMLVLLGLDVLRRLYQKRVHFHRHRHHDGVEHFHAHRHQKKQPHDDSAHQHEHSSLFPLRALLVGLMHGMAGSAALILLTMNSVENTAGALFYIAFFGIGSILGMALLSCVIAIPLRFSEQRLTRVYNGLHLSVALFTVTIGAMMIFEYVGI
ncbi:MAG: urease accessory protein [Mariprofundaceae bacterium]|nr:urease accessory protein [Mariprofundaceae bacterium]